MSYIRKATTDDLEALLKLERIFLSDRIGRQQFRHLLQKGNADIWLYETPEGIQADAVVLYRKNLNHARLYSLVVNPALRGQGIATNLLKHLETQAQRRHCQSIRLEVREDNTAARKLYEKQGYTLKETITNYYQDGATALKLQKFLNQATDSLTC